MLFVDECATLQFIDFSAKERVKDFKIINEQVFFVKQDLFLLENQLPYELLDKLMETSADKENLKKSIEIFIDKASKPYEPRKQVQYEKQPIHLLDLLQTRLLGNTLKIPEKPNSKKFWRTFCNLRELQKVGIRLKCRHSFLDDIKFRKNGISTPEPLSCLH